MEFALEKIGKNMKDILSKYSLTTIHAKLVVLDIALLSLEQKDATDYIKKYKIYPGYSKYFSTYGLLNYTYILKGPDITDNDMVKFSSSIDDMIKVIIKNNPINGFEAMGLAQRDWQRYYIFKTYLIYLFLNHQKITPLYNNLCHTSIDDIVSICMITKILSEKELLKWLIERIGSVGEVLDNLKDFIVKEYNFLIININDYKKKQEAKLKASGNNIFATRMLIKDYPIINIMPNLNIFSSLIYLQDAILSRIIRHISNGGSNSKEIGDAFEDIVYEQFKNYYSHITIEDDRKKIYLNPSTKKSGELCDVLVFNKNDILLIDCKAKEMTEEYYDDNSSDSNIIIEKFRQRVNRLKDIKQGKFSKYIDSSFDINNIYSLIVMVDDGIFSKDELFKKSFGEFNLEEYEFYKKHINVISFEDLLEAITANVDIIEIMKRMIINNEYDNHLRICIKAEDKSDYNDAYKNWYDESVNKSIKFLIDKKIIPFSE